MNRKITFLIIGILLSISSIAQPGNSLNFDGVDDVVVVPNDPILEFLTGTIEVWLKPGWVSGTAGYNPSFIGMRDGSGSRFSFHIRNDYSAIDLYNGLVGTVTYAFSQGEWYHIALVIKISTTDVYINGIFQGTMNRTLHTGNTGKDLHIGSGNGSSENFKGEIDEVRIWSSQRTACEILSYRNTELVGNEANLITYYNFNQGFAGENNGFETSLTDLTGNQFDGTLNNFTLQTTTSNWIASGADVTTSNTPVDNIPPTLTIPTDITIECGSGFDPVNTGMATATDICDASPVITYSDVNNGSTITRTWKATDASDNETTGDQIITIIDNTPPATPVLDTLKGLTSVTATAPTTNDACDGTITGTTFDSTHYATQGIYNISWKFEDGSGNNTKADQMVIVDNGQNMMLEFNTSLSAGTTITLPLNGTVDVSVFWGDGDSTNTTTSANLSHTYSEEGTYTVMITGTLTHFGRSGYPNADKLVRVASFGDLGVTDFSYAFHNAKNLTEVPATLPPGVTNLSYMFYWANKFNQDLNGWDVSSVTNMSYMFSTALKFNGNISNWNVSNVTNMSGMFYIAPNFNQDISSWDVSKVTDMSYMFYYVSAFNQDISNWNVSNVTNMSYMFNNAYSFNKDIGSWDISNVTNTSRMFIGASSFNGDISSWNTAKITNMGYMFYNDTSFNQNIGTWDVSNVTDMIGMLSGTDLSTTNYDSLLNAWSALTLKPNVTFDAGNSKYSCLSSNARTKIINDFNWTINDSGLLSDDVGISTQPESSISVYENTPDTSLYVEASGDLELYYQWYKDDVAIISDGDSSSLIITTQPTSSGTYHCVVTSVCGTSQQSNDAVVDILDDTTAPEIPALEDLTGECSVTAVAPTTTDAVAGIITGTTTDSLEYAVQGSYTITWTFNDGNGNSINVAQNVTVDDITPPDTPNLQTAFGEDSVIVTAPTTIDGCAGTITGTTFDSTHYEVQGTYTITWIFDDGNGNSTTADQEVIVHNGQNMLLEFNTNLSAGTTITLPLNGTVDVTVDWGDGNSESTTNSANLSYTYSSEGTYLVTISGSLTHFGRSSYPNADKLTRAIGFGSLGITDLSYAFYAAKNLIEVPSILPTGVTNTSYMFYQAFTFNQDLNSWDVSNVTNMSWMFGFANAFNGNISGWDVSNVTDMSWMFGWAYAFNGNISGWNVGQVTTMENMFFDASVFNQDLNNWDVSNVVNMRGMFGYALVFNGNISNWNVSKVQNMANMFSYTNEFNQDIGNWNTSSVTDMSSMFGDAALFNRNISNWDVSNVTDMSYMFSYTDSFNQDISNWDVSAATTMEGMFEDAALFNGNISNWNVSNVTSMKEMFYEAPKFNGDISGWDVSNVTDMSYMFNYANSFNQDIGNWDVRNVTNMSDMFWEAALSTVNYDALLNAWSTLTLQNNVTFHGGNSTYSCLSEAARTKMINDFNWNINDAGLFSDDVGISVQPESSTNVWENTEDIVLSVEANGEIALSYQWYKDDEAITSDGDSSSLIITTLPTNSGTYVCVVTSACGASEQSANAIVEIMDDITAPETPALADLTGECSVTVVAPTTTDAAAGTITGTTSDPLEYTEQGNYTIIWTFDDGNGNSIDVNQNVIVNDVTNPTITCIDNQTVNADATSNYTVQGTEFDLIVADDNCGVGSVENDFNNSSTLGEAQFPVGTTTVTWTITDNAGNTNSCSFDIIVNNSTGIKTIENSGISVYPNPVSETINFSFSDYNVVQLTILDITGKILFVQPITQKNKSLNVSGWKNGVYIVRFQTDKEVMSTKIIKE